MAKIGKWAILIIALAGILPVCGDKSTNSDFTPIGDFPLRVGTSWHYRIELLSINDSTYQDSTIAYLIRGIAGDTTIDGIDLLVMDDTLFSLETGTTDTSVQRYWMAMAQSKLLRYATDYNAMDSFPPNLDSTPYIILDFPLTPGKIWLNPPNGAFIDTCQVIGYETILAAGEERLCGVVQTDPSYYSPFPENRQDWYADIGLAKSVIVAGHIRKQWILVDYYPFNY